MINLIPNEEKKKMARDFYQRVLIMFLVVFSFGVLVACASLLPAYLLSVEKKSLVDAKLETQKNETIPEPDQKSMAIINDLTNKLNLIGKAQNNEYDVSQKIISEIISQKIPGIKITEIFYTEDPTSGKKVNVDGLASSREQLLLFRDALGADPLFKTVDLPISNFVKGSNIPFYLNLIPS
jgi:cell division protein FtsB